MRETLHVDVGREIAVDQIRYEMNGTTAATLMVHIICVYGQWLMRMLLVHLGRHAMRGNVVRLLAMVLWLRLWRQMPGLMGRLLRLCRRMRWTMVATVHLHRLIRSR